MQQRTTLMSKGNGGSNMTISVEREGNEAKLIERGHHTWSLTIPSHSGTLHYVIDRLKNIQKEIEEETK